MLPAAIMKVIWLMKWIIDEFMNQLWMNQSNGRPINTTNNSFQLALPNGRADELWCVAGLRPPLRIEKWVGGLLWVVGYGLLRQPNAPRKEENSPTNSLNNEAKQESQPIHNSNSNSLPPSLPRTMNGLLCCGAWVESIFSFLSFLRLCGLMGLATAQCSAQRRRQKERKGKLMEWKPGGMKSGRRKHNWSDEIVCFASAMNEAKTAWLQQTTQQQMNWWRWINSWLLLWWVCFHFTN